MSSYSGNFTDGPTPTRTPSHTLPGAPRLRVVRWLELCLESEAAEGEKLKSPLARLWGAILRFGKNVVGTPGRTHDNHYVTKGLKVSLKPFQRLAGPGRRPGRSPQGAKHLSHLSGGSIFLCYFLFAIEKESRRLPPCNRVSRKYTPVGCFARTHPLRRDGHWADPPTR